MYLGYSRLKNKRSRTTLIGKTVLSARLSNGLPAKISQWRKHSNVSTGISTDLCRRTIYAIRCLIFWRSTQPLCSRLSWTVFIDWWISSKLASSRCLISSAWLMTRTHTQLQGLRRRWPLLKLWVAWTKWALLTGNLVRFSKWGFTSLSNLVRLKKALRLLLKVLAKFLLTFSSPILTHRIAFKALTWLCPCYSVFFRN